MIDNENQTPNATPDPGAAGSTEPAPTPTPTTPKVEIKDGHTLVDGKKMVAESDLIAAKQSLESQLTRAQTVHNEAIDASKIELSAANQTVADLNAKLTVAEQARQAGATSGEDVAGIKLERDNALLKVGTLQTEADKSLDYRRELIATRYSIPVENLANKSMVELDSFEEALKAVTTSRGNSPGPYALGGSLGGATPMTPQERATQVLATTPMHGVRNVEPAK